MTKRVLVLLALAATTTANAVGTHNKIQIIADCRSNDASDSTRLKIMYGQASQKLWLARENSSDTELSASVEKNLAVFTWPDARLGIHVTRNQWNNPARFIAEEKGVTSSKHLLCEFDSASFKEIKHSIENTNVQRLSIRVSEPRPQAHAGKLLPQSPAQK
jgi:hypothetical protein